MTSQDMKSAQGTYGSFITLLRVAVPVIAITALIVITLIAD